MVQITSGKHTFGPVTGVGPRAETETVTLPAPVRDATAFLTGFHVEFTPLEDHNFGELSVQVAVEAIEPTSGQVTVLCTYGLRDWSDTFDDAYDGTIFFAVISLP